MKYLKLYEDFNKESFFTSRITCKKKYGTDNISGIDDLELVEYENVMTDNGGQYNIWRSSNGEYILSYINDIVDIGTECWHLHEEFERALAKLINKLSSYKFQKEYLTKHPERINELKKIGLTKKIKEKFPDLIEGSEFGFFGLKESKILLDPSKLENIEDAEFIINQIVDPSDKNSSTSYQIYRTKDGKYVLAKNNVMIDYEDEVYQLRRFIVETGIPDYNVFLEAMNKLILKMKSYEFQKDYLTKHPERVKELKEFGFNEKIKEEFADIIEGSEFGFFGLKESVMTDKYQDIFLYPHNFNTIYFSENIKRELDFITEISFLSMYNHVLKYQIYKSNNGKYVIIFDNKRISNIYDNEYFSRIINIIKSYYFQKKFIKEHSEKLFFLKDIGFNEKIKKEFPDLIEGNEFGFFNLR